MVSCTQLTEGIQMNKLVSISLIFTLLSTAGYAQSGDKPPNRCAFFSVMISNNTKEVCRLVEKEIIYGKMSSFNQVPVLIAPGNSTPPFEMKQILAGPEISLTYECGRGNVVAFRSKQGFCAMVHGNVRGKVEYSQNLKAKYTKTNGSYLWNERGEISWTLTSY